MPIFYNSAGQEVASVTLDLETGGWAISTIPLKRFQSEDAAVRYFLENCDPNTGLPRALPYNFE